MPGIDSEPADREPGMVHLALQKRGLAGLGARLLANLQAFGERPLPRNFGLDPVRLLLGRKRSNRGLTCDCLTSPQPARLAPRQSEPLLRPWLCPLRRPLLRARVRG